MNRPGEKKGSILGSIAGAIINLFTKKAPPANLKKADFSASSQKIGLRFTDKIRNKFRYKWLKKR